MAQPERMPAVSTGRTAPGAGCQLAEEVGSAAEGGWPGTRPSSRQSTRAGSWTGRCMELVADR